MATNPQWGLPPPPQGPNHLALDASILDYKALNMGNMANNQHNNISDTDQHGFHAFNSFFQAHMANKEISQFGKPPPAQANQGAGFNSYNNYNSSGSMQFSIGTFSTNDRPPSSMQNNMGTFSSNDRPPSTMQNNMGTFSNNERGTSSMQNNIGTFSSNERSSGSMNNSSSSYPAVNSVGDVFSSSTVPIPGMAGVGGGQNFNQQNSSDPSGSNQGVRETGIIEKLLQHSYGFIQCCERQARLFFHFSQFNGNIEHLKIGDPVEFEMTYDRRTGKPIASAVSKIAPEVVGVVLSEERVTGTVTTELRTDGPDTTTMGRISYENRGECFFLPYNKDDVEGNVTLRSGDKVSFQIAAKQRGNLGACHIRLENPAHPVRYKGAVCSLKESFGFIERADVVKEIFFHFSEAKLAGSDDQLHVGDDVEFNIQTRNGKEVACNITRLEPGSVVFEDVCTEIVRGQVLKPLERGHPPRPQEDPLTGRIRYRAADHSEVEISFGDKDQRPECTLRHGDWVQFRVATDRRDQLRRATHISLLEESFHVSGERREQGVVVSMKDGFGFIKCAERDLSVYFNFNEVLDADPELQLNDEVEFTIVQDTQNSYGNNRQSAIRIKHVPTGTVQFETLIEQGVSGTVAKEPQHHGQRTPSKHNSQSPEKLPDPGLINYQQGDTKKAISFYQKDIEGKVNLRVGDKVEFAIVQVKRSKEYLGVNVRLVSGKAQNGVAECQGFVAALKDTFGFIETLQHDREIFFHFSQLDGDSDKLELGMEVEYNMAPRGGQGSCMAAENVKMLPKGTIQVPVCDAPIIDGIIVRPLRCVNPDQSEYAGLVQANEDGKQYEFGITGLVNKRELLQPNDPVQFQVDADNRAANIVAVRKKRKATVDAVKGHFGFLNYEVEEGKKLFFHMSEVKEGVPLQPGDAVEFTLVTNQRNGKSSACNLTKITDMGARPERLVNRLRTFSIEDGGPRLIVIRQPKGPDSKGFPPEARLARAAGVLLDAEA